MNSSEKLKMFTQVHFDIHCAHAWSDEMKHGGNISQEQASELLRRCQKANASSQAFERAMHGIESPRGG